MVKVHLQVRSLPELFFGTGNDLLLGSPKHLPWLFVSATPQSAWDRYGPCGRDGGFDSRRGCLVSIQTHEESIMKVGDVLNVTDYSYSVRIRNDGQLMDMPSMEGMDWEMDSPGALRRNRVRVTYARPVRQSLLK